jgi:hypothetical protein
MKDVAYLVDATNSKAERTTLDTRSVHVVADEQNELRVLIRKRLDLGGECD